MKKLAWISSALVLVGALAVVRANGPGGSGVLARLSLQDGSEYLLTQRWNDWTEPYTVAFWFRQPGGDWGWCYIDHEASRWRNASLRHDVPGQSVQVLRDGTLEAELYLERSTFALHGKREREFEAPYELIEPPYLVSD